MASSDESGLEPAARDGRRLAWLPKSVGLASTTTGLGGLWRHVEDLGLALQDAGVEVIIGLLPQAAELHEAVKHAGLRWTPLHRSLSRDIDVWHVHLGDTYDRLAFADLAARRLLGPAVITEHLPRTHASDPSLASYFPRTRGAAVAKTLFKKTEFALASEVIAVSSSSAHFLEHRYGLRPGRITRVHNGIDLPNEATAAPAPSQAPVEVLALGSLGWQKGFDVLLRAIGMSKSNWKVTLVGAGAQLEPLQEIARTLPPGRVEFAGWVDDPRPHLLAADVLCMPSRWESFPYAALEAGALARPVVGTRVDGLDEIIENEVTGVLVKPEDPAGLARALDRLAAEPELIAAFGSAARQRVKRFSLSTMVSETMAVYKQACQSYKLRPGQRSG